MERVYSKFGEFLLRGCELKMGDHLALLVNRLLTESTLHAAIESRNRAKQVEEGGEVEYFVPKVDAGDVLFPSKLVECRICQDEDLDSNMETPCSCCGSLKVGWFVSLFPLGQNLCMVGTWYIVYTQKKVSPIVKKISHHFLRKVAPISVVKLPLLLKIRPFS